MAKRQKAWIFDAINLLDLLGSGSTSMQLTYSDIAHAKPKPSYVDVPGNILLDLQRRTNSNVPLPSSSIIIRDSLLADW